MPHPPSPAEEPNPPEAGSPEVVVGAWKDSARPRRRTFPGPRGARSELRVAMDRAAFAEITAHAKGSLEAEVCGVLAGLECEDDDGLFVHVQAAVRGSAASGGKTHVTFTQETWASVHQELEHAHPKLRMVGWYHTHPGFGVEFSEMDLFIQRNFFSGPAQIAFVTDPLGGAIAICINTAAGVRYLDRFWVEGREQPCQAPRLTGAAALSQPAAATEASGETLERRLGQLTQAIDELRVSYHRFLLTCAMFVAVGMLMLIGWTLWRSFAADRKPPEVLSYLPIPVKVGDRSVMLGVGIAKWDLPPELDPELENAELRREIAALKGGQTSSAAPQTPPAQPSAPTLLISTAPQAVPAPAATPIPMPPAAPQPPPATPPPGGAPIPPP